MRATPCKRNNDWELLVDMQHYGIPTRLMDWTDVLGVALAFALYDSNNDHESSAIYILDPISLNKLSGLEEIKRAPNDPDFKYKSIYWHGRPFKALLPIAMDCGFHNDRIAAQKGNFTIHGANSAPIDAKAPSTIRKIVLESSAKPEAR
jgi:FRG domain